MLPSAAAASPSQLVDSGDRRQNKSTHIESFKLYVEQIDASKHLTIDIFIACLVNKSMNAS